MLTTLSKIVYRAGSQFASVEDSHVAAEVGLPILTATAVSGVATPSDGGAGGVFTLVGTNSWSYTPKNEFRVITLTVTDSVGPVAKTLTVFGTLPINPDFGYEWDTPTLSKVITAKDNSPRFRRAPKRTGIWTLGFSRRTIMDVSVMKTFEFYHDINLEFYLLDPEIEQQIKMRLDSSIKVRVAGANLFEMSCIVKSYQLTSFTIPTAYS